MNISDIKFVFSSFKFNLKFENKCLILKLLHFDVCNLIKFFKKLTK